MVVVILFTPRLQNLCPLHEALRELSNSVYLSGVSATEVQRKDSLTWDFQVGENTVETAGLELRISG